MFLCIFAINVSRLYFVVSTFILKWYFMNLEGTFAETFEKMHFNKFSVVFKIRNMVNLVQISLQ